MISDYEERYCLFLDILGFKEIINASVSERNNTGTPQASEIFFGLKRIASTLNYKLGISGKSGEVIPSSRKVTQFSDSVVVSYLADEIGSLADMLYDVLHLQLKLINRNMLIRGAITRGKLYHSEDLVFGPALVEAAELEKLAMYPRVIVDREILQDAGIVDSGFSSPSKPSLRTPESLVTRDLDGLYFVDYFAVYPEDFDDDWGDTGHYLLKLRDVVKGLSQKKQLSVRMKHSWLRQKFNEVAETKVELKSLQFNGHTIPEEEVDLFRGITVFR